MSFTASQLRPVLQRHAALVDQALAALYPDPDRPLSLDGLRPLTELDKDLADVLVEALEGDGTPEQAKAEALRAFLNARGIELAPPVGVEARWDHTVPTLPDAGIPVPVPNDFDLDAVGTFAPRAAAFRCRIEIGGQDEGSGAFVSKSLVLTAGHVVERHVAANQAADALPAHAKLSVRASDGVRYTARCVWYSPVHAEEREGRLPPAAEADAHLDVAVLRVGLPLGLSYGYADLPEEPVEWTGARLMTLVHYPAGKVRGFTRGRVLREAATDIRLPHDIDTSGGSSGGPAFDHKFRFIGIHQGRWDKFRKLVPHGQFADEPEFVDVLKRDRAPPRYLWSLQDDLDGQIIIGRGVFFEALTHMLENPAGTLRGIWLRRIDQSVTTGLSFSLEMLDAFLQNRRLPSDPPGAHRTWRIPIGLEDTDPIQDIARQVLGAQAAAAHAGVRPGETSGTATDRARAGDLLEDIQRRAAAAGRTEWLFFEGPPEGALSERAQKQFEALAEQSIPLANLRLILAGFEQYRLPVVLYETVAAGRADRRRGLLIDRLDRFDLADVKVTLRAMHASLLNDDNPAPNKISDMADEIVRNVPSENGFYAFAELERVSRRIQSRFRLLLGLD